MSDENVAFETLATVFHEAWVSWSKTIAEEEEISPERLQRWQTYWVDYSDLPEDAKDHDRKWANRWVDKLIEQGFTEDMFVESVLND